MLLQSAEIRKIYYLALQQYVTTALQGNHCLADKLVLFSYGVVLTSKLTLTGPQLANLCHKCKD